MNRHVETFDDARGARLDVTGVTMMFDSFAALDDVSVSFDPGRVHAIVGQNGAGKTTFSRVVTGLYRPTRGSVAIDGVALHGSVTESRHRGIDMVHQNFSLPGSFTVAEALYLFDPAHTVRPYRRAELHRLCRAKLAEYGPNVDPGARIRDLSIETRQGLEITRALSGDTRILLLDEPTAALPPEGVTALFDRVTKLARAGTTVLVVLHKLEEVWAVADTVTVLRDGQVTIPLTDLSALTREQVTTAIIGEELPSETPAASSRATEVDSLTAELLGASHQPARHVVAGQHPVLLLSGVSTKRVAGDAALDDVTLRVQPGELVGVAGVEGNGQRSLVEAAAGLTPVTRGTVAIDDHEVTTTDLRGRRRLGLRIIPFDRNSQGVSLTSALWLNVGVAEVLMNERPWFSPRRVREHVRQAVELWGVKHRSIGQAAGELSGGNVQRAILAREATDGSRVVIAAQPTRGLDLGAAAMVHRSLRRLAEQGAGVLMISTDLDELRGNCDRIVVLRGGRAAADLLPTASLLELGHAMVGGETHED